MKFYMDKTLREIVEQAYEDARLGRNGRKPDPELVLSETLADLESNGSAMRYLDNKGRVAWKATPGLRDHIMNLELEAKTDLDDED